MAWGSKKDGNSEFPEGIISQGTEPNEPQKKRLRPNLVKLVFFAIFITYIILSYFHVPILTGIGSYLVVKHPIKKSDLIVCLSGGTVDRGLAAVDVYSKKLAPKIFIAREINPDGYEKLLEKGINYPRTTDLLVKIFMDLGVPRSSIFITEKPVESTFAEAKAVRDFVEKEDYSSIILITSPTHTRRTWLTFKKIFKNQPVRILIMPSPYSGFRPDNWWKKRKWVRTVIIEYQKLIFYTIKYFI